MIGHWDYTTTGSGVLVLRRYGDEVGTVSLLDPTIGSQAVRLERIVAAMAGYDRELEQSISRHCVGADWPGLGWSGVDEYAALVARIREVRGRQPEPEAAAMDARWKADYGRHPLTSEQMAEWREAVSVIAASPDGRYPDEGIAA